MVDCRRFCSRSHNRCGISLSFGFDGGFSSLCLLLRAAPPRLGGTGVVRPEFNPDSYRVRWCPVMRAQLRPSDAARSCLDWLKTFIDTECDVGVQPAVPSGRGVVSAALETIGVLTTFPLLLGVYSGLSR